MSEIEDAEKPSTFTRVKKFIKENQGPLTFGAGIGVGAIIVSQYPEFFLKPKSSRYPFGSSYRPDQPIPDLLMSESGIKRELAANILAVEFLKTRDLSQDFTDFTKQRITEIDQLIQK